MTLDRVAVSEDVADRLGEASLGEIRACLWPMDCQTCGSYIGDQPVSLCVDYLDRRNTSHAVASVHHVRCRPSEWSSRAVARGVQVTYTTRCLLLPDYLTLGDRDHRPMMLVNPSAEHVVLTRDDSGCWKINVDVHRPWGLRPLSPEYSADRPIAAGSAVLQRRSISVSLGTNTWSAPIPDMIRKHVVELGGVTLALSHSIVPGPTGTIEELAAHLLCGRIVLGWTALR